LPKQVIRTRTTRTELDKAYGLRKDGKLKAYLTDLQKKGDKLRGKGLLPVAEHTRIPQ